MSELQKKKNIRLLLILLSLTVITVVVYIFDGVGDKVGIDKDLFLIQDVRNIDKILIDKGFEKLTIRYDRGKWMVNDEIDADMSRVDVLFAIINQVKVRRPVAKSEVEQVKNKLTKSGSKVSIFEGESVVKEFYAGGNDDKSEAYFMPIGGEPYVVNIPGYQSYVSGIFEMRRKDWRNRLIFATNNWLTLDRMSLSYSKYPNEGIDVVYGNDNTYRIEQLQEADTAQMYAFMEAVSFLQVYDYIQPGEYPEYDSLQSLGPQASITVSDVSTNRKKLDFYRRIPNDRYVLGVIDSAEAALFNYTQVKKVLKLRKDFIKADK